MGFLRIVAGRLGGRRIRVMDRGGGGGLRPSQERVREAIFSSLGERVVGARVLDLCAGTGALGIEAWSRGASFVVWVERDRGRARGIRDSLRVLGMPVEAGRVVEGDVLRGLVFLGEARFDGVFADPPYDWGVGDYGRLMGGVREVVVEGGWLVLECGVGLGDDFWGRGWERQRVRRYGETVVQFFCAV